MKACSGGSAMWRGWRGIRLLKESMQESVQVVVHWVGHERVVFKEKRFGCKASKDNGPG